MKKGENVNGSNFGKSPAEQLGAALSLPLCFAVFCLRSLDLRGSSYCEDGEPLVVEERHRDQYLCHQICERTGVQRIPF